MSLTYTGADGIFTQIGKLVQYYNKVKEAAVDNTDGLNADRDEILDAFQAADQDAVIDGLVSAYERWKSEAVEQRGSLAEFVISRLTDKNTVLKELGIDTSSIQNVVAELISEMELENESIQESSTTVGSVTANSGNEGGGTILVTDILDGATSPGSFNGVRMPANLKYKGKTTELGSNETFRFKVTADSYQDGLTEGSEEISWQGCPQSEPHGLDDGGSGYVGTIQPLNGSTSQYVANADFESFTSNDPDDWDIVAGTAGTHILEETTTVSNGTSGLKFKGDGVQTTIEVKQDIDPTTVVANKMYCVAVKMHKPAVFGGSTADLVISFEGTGYTAGSSEKISKAINTIHANGFKLYHFFVTMPSVIPDDLKLVIRLDGTSSTPASNDVVMIDDLNMGPVNYGGGVGLVAIRDSGPFVRGDRFSVSVSNTEGVFQGFFRKVLGVQLPSSATPTISDTLVTGPIS